MAVALLVAIVSTTAWVVSGAAGTIAVEVPQTLHDRRPAATGPQVPGFPIDVVGALWATTAGGDVDPRVAQVRFRHDGRWSAWRPMGVDGVEAPGEFATGLVTADDADAYEVRGVPARARVVALNTTDGPLVTTSHRRVDAAAAAPACRSRADWGADESLMTWPPVYQVPTVLTLHHTDTANDDADPAATMRAIYRFHAVDRGFGDIGYQYVVDQAGVVYEGRSSGTSDSCALAGGSGHDFGHEEAAGDRAVVGAHVSGWNSANIGIALLGTYTDSMPPTAQRSALEEMLTGLSERHGIDPLDTAYAFTNPANGEQRTVPRISGHRDWEATLCPGQSFYDTLPAIRAGVDARRRAQPTSTTTTSTTSTTSTVAPTTTASPPPPPPPPRSGYWMVAADGTVYAFGDAENLGSSTRANVVDLEPTPSGRGYWLVDAGGAVTAHGDAPPVMHGPPLLAPFEAVTSISSAGPGRGYWLFTTKGRVLGYDGAPWYGDMGATILNGPVLDSIPTPTGRGYYLVASDGGIFTFGDATFRGSMGGTPLNAPVQSLVPDGDGVGYWLVAADGGIFTFDATFYGSMGSVPLNRPITGMIADGSAGYLMVAEDGGIFTFGTARFHGSLGDQPSAAAITSAATVPA